MRCLVATTRGNTVSQFISMAAIWKSGEAKTCLSSAINVTLSVSSLESLYRKVLGCILGDTELLGSKRPVNLSPITVGVHSMLRGFQGLQFGHRFYTWVFIRTCSTLRLCLF